MNTPVKHGKSTSLGKACNPSRDPSKPRKFFFFSPEKGPSGTEKDVYVWLFFFFFF